MNFGLLFFGVVFLFLPNTALYDLLPDFIGYLLLLRGISRWADLSLAMEGAKRSFLKLFYLGIFKTLTLILLLIVEKFVSAPDGGYMGLFTFFFNGMEAILFITGFNRFFNGMEYLTTRHGSETAAKHSTDVRTMTCIFIIVKSALGAFAQIGGLFGESVSPNILTGGAQAGSYGRLLLIANLLLTSIVGTIWLCMLLRYLSEIRNDTAFCERVDALYNTQILPDTALFLRRRMRLAFLFFGGGMFCMIDLTISGVNMIPDVLGILLFLGGMVVLCGDKLFSKWIFLPTGIWAGAALAEELVSGFLYNLDLDRIDTYGVSYTPQVFAKYLSSGVLSTLTAGLFVAVMFLLAGMFRKIARAHTGMDAAEGETRTAERNAAMQRELFLRIRIFLLVTVVYAMSCVAYGWLVPFFRMYWLIHVIAGIVWFFHSARFVSMLYDQIEYKYL